MGIGLDFPEDPTRPDPGQHIASGREITIAWKKQAIALGTGLLLSSKSKDTPSLANAFQDPKERPQVIFFKDSFASYRQLSSSNVTQSSQHVSASLTLEVDLCGGLVGGSVQGSYDRQVDKNTDDEKVSIHSTYRFGVVKFPDLPQFTYDAWNAVPSRVDRIQNIDNFTQKYGDYYVGGLVLGADNAVMVSSATSSEHTVEHESLTVKVKVLCFEKSTTKTWTQEHSSYIANMTLTGFDSLTGELVPHPDPAPPKQTPSSGAAFPAATAHSIAQQHPAPPFDVAKMQQLVTQGLNVDERVFSEFNKMGLSDGDPVTSETCARLCEAGLVVSIILMPFAKCADYIAARNRRTR